MSMGAPFDESVAMAVDEELDNNTDDLNCTMVDNDVDIQSVLSGTVGDDDEEDNSQLQLVFGKNLRSAFENADVADEMMASSASLNRQDDNRSRPADIKAAEAGKASFSRPPLAPGRPATANSIAGGGGASNFQSMSSTVDGNNISSNLSQNDKRLSVFLRVRPPVGTNVENKSAEGSISTIEIVADKNKNAASSLPSTIRTYPPLNSNAAKVVRSGNRKAKSSVSSSKSFNDDGSTDSGGNDGSSAEVRGVKEYSYSGIFGPNSTQKDVYDNVAAPLVEGLFPKKNSTENGGNPQEQFQLGESALLFTLGVTNAGKTHTVMGSGFDKRKKGGFGQKALQANENGANPKPHKDWGVIPRSLDHMLARINDLNKQSCPGPQLQLYMSYLEIYNENIYDLLPDKTKKEAVKRYPGDGPPALKLRESRRGRIFVRGLAKHPVNNVQEGLELAREAKTNRHTASNNINANSSRSHSICQFEIAYFQGQDPMRTSGDDSECETDDESVCSASSSNSRRNSRRKSTIIWIVDLAGSERSKRTGAMSHTRHQKEAALINASLMNLMRCLREMLNHQPKKRGGMAKGGVVPFRESKLTHMFMNHLTGPAASKTSMIVNVNPAADDYDETQHVLGYATTARSVTVSEVDYNRKCRALAKESNVKLKEEVSQVKSLAKKLVQKISPKKRKGAPDSKPEAKRQRSNSHKAPFPKAQPFPAQGKTFGSSNTAMHAQKSKGVQTGNIKQLQQLREERFILNQTVEELEQQLQSCEAEVREEVVATMNEQLEENKEWYERKIVELKEKVNLLQTSNLMKQRTIDAQNEHINECEDEMKRMRDDYEAHIEDLNSNILKLTYDNHAEKETILKSHKKDHDQYRRLEAEAGALRHQTEELRTSHSVLLSKYNDLVASMQQREREDRNDPAPEKENDANAQGHSLPSPSYKKLPRERCSDVASTDCTVDIITSPKKKRGGWFMRSPAKVGAQPQQSPKIGK